MSARSDPSRGLFLRAWRRGGRELRTWTHTWADARLLRRLRVEEDSPRVTESLALADRAATPGAASHDGPVARVGSASPDPASAGEIRAEAEELLADRITLFGRACPLADPDAWHADPLRDRPWPRRPHARIRLDEPDRPGDLRMQWEAARFHHAPLLALAWRRTRDERYARAFLRHVDAFAQGNPPFRGIHWSVGMEVGLRGAALAQALRGFGGAAALDASHMERLRRLLFLHGVFLETHPDRHPEGFTTNHTTAALAGLAVLARGLADESSGRRWLDAASEGMQTCLREQVLAGGAHAEGSLLYERFVLEAGLVAALALEPMRAEPLAAPLEALAEHLAQACLSDGLPAVGDGDDSFFPPFAACADARREPRDARPVLHLAAAVLGRPDLRPPTPTPRFLELLDLRPLGRTATGAPRTEGATSARGRGFLPFEAGPFRGLLVVRGDADPWMATHGHNDLLSVLLDADGAPLLVDPGTGGYGWDRALRHRLRSTASHSTLSVRDREQSPIRQRATFEGPRTVPAGGRALRPDPLRLEGWFEGFAGLRHRRRIQWRAGALWIEDLLTTASGGESPELEVTLRFRFAPGVRLSLQEAPESPRPAGPAARRRVVHADLDAGRAGFHVLRPRRAVWQIGAAEASSRYARREELPVLEATVTSALPLRWLTRIAFDRATGAHAASPGVRAGADAP